MSAVRVGAHYFVPATCAHCGIAYMARRGLKRGSGRYCSRRCGGYAGKIPLLDRVDRSGGPDACWPWLGRIEKHGYGRATINGRHVLAHRAVYAELVDAVPAELDLLHSCDNPPCC